MMEATARRACVPPSKHPALCLWFIDVPKKPVKHQKLKETKNKKKKKKTRAIKHTCRADARRRRMGRRASARRTRRENQVKIKEKWGKKYLLQGGNTDRIFSHGSINQEEIYVKHHSLLQIHKKNQMIEITWKTSRLSRINTQIFHFETKVKRFFLTVYRKSSIQT